MAGGQPAARSEQAKANAERVEAVLGGFVLGEGCVQEKLEEVVDGGVRKGAEGDGVIEEKRGVVATDTAARETELKALDPVGGIGDVGGVEG